MFSQGTTQQQPLKIALTGYAGFVGGQIEACARLRGYETIRLGRRNPDIEWSLGDRLGPDDLRDVDVMIHCAHDFTWRSSDEAFQLNGIGSLRLLEDAEAAGIRKFVFISSMAAERGNQSLYGRQKRETEALLGGRAMILRPGLVWDENGGGLVGAIGRLARSVPVLPVPNIRQRNLAAIHNNDLAEVVLQCRHEEENRVVSVAHPETMNLPQLASRIVVSNGSKCRLFPVRPNLARRVLATLEQFSTAGGFRSDSLTSLMTSPPPSPPEPDPLGVSVRPFPGSQLG